MSVSFIAEVSSNHARDLDRSLAFIDRSAEIGCDAVKFQLFKIEQLFSPEILARRPGHLERKKWELPVEFLPDLARRCREKSIQFSCTPFYLKAVEELCEYVDFYKIASYEMIWDDLIHEIGRTSKPLVMSTGMATLDEIQHAVEVFQKSGGHDLTLLHCVSAYPTPVDQANLGAIETIRNETGVPVGWSDHSRSPAVVERAIHRWGATTVEFHLDLEGTGAEYAAGHCWLPEEIEPVIARIKSSFAADGNGIKEPTPAELHDRMWRADPSDGLRPLIATRRKVVLEDHQ